MESDATWRKKHSSHVRSQSRIVGNAITSRTIYKIVHRTTQSRKWHMPYDTHSRIWKYSADIRTTSVVGRDAETGWSLHTSVEEEVATRWRERGRPARDQTGHIESEVLVTRVCNTYLLMTVVSLLIMCSVASAVIFASHAHSFVNSVNYVYSNILITQVLLNYNLAVICLWISLSVFVVPIRFWFPIFWQSTYFEIFT